MDGARAVLQSVLNDFPNTDISVSIVWIQMPGFVDNTQSAERMATTFDDPRVKHFYDPLTTHRAGNMFARNIIAHEQGPAWDIYFFYDKKDKWNEYPPEPAEYMHQLSGGQRAMAERFRTQGGLTQELHAAMHRLTGELCKGAGS